MPVSAFPTSLMFEVTLTADVVSVVQLFPHSSCGCLVASGV